MEKLHAELLAPWLASRGEWGKHHIDKLSISFACSCQATTADNEDNHQGQCDLNEPRKIKRHWRISSPWNWKKGQRTGSQSWILSGCLIASKFLIWTTSIPSHAVLSRIGCQRLLSSRRHSNRQVNNWHCTWIFTFPKTQLTIHWANVLNVVVTSCLLTDMNWQNIVTGPVVNFKPYKMPACHFKCHEVWGGALAWQNFEHLKDRVLFLFLYH